MREQTKESKKNSPSEKNSLNDTMIPLKELRPLYNLIKNHEARIKELEKGQTIKINRPSPLSPQIDLKDFFQRDFQIDVQTNPIANIHQFNVELKALFAKYHITKAHISCEQT